MHDDLGTQDTSDVHGDPGPSRTGGGALIHRVNGHEPEAGSGSGERDNEAGVRGFREAEGSRSPELNESLARLERNSLEVKLYLDSIDQRISRMEPRLDGIRTSEMPEAGVAEGGAAVDAERIAPPMTLRSAPEERYTRSEHEVERTGDRERGGDQWREGDGQRRGQAEQRVHAEQPGDVISATGERLSGDPEGAEFSTTELSTTERRRRAQGVPVERRRSPYTAPAEFELPQVPKWGTRVEGLIERLPLPAAYRRWAPAALLLALAAVIGLVFWGSRRETPRRLRPGGVDAGGVVSVAVPNGRPKGSADIPWPVGRGADTGGSAYVAGASASAADGAARGGRLGTGPIEQGVAAPGAPETLGAPGQTQVVSGQVSVVPGAATALGTKAAGIGGPGVVGPGLVGPAGVGSGVVGSGVVGPTASGPGQGASGEDSATVGGVGKVAGADGGEAPAKGGSVGVGSVVGDRGTIPVAHRVNVSSGVMAGNLIYSQQPAYPKGFAGMFHTEGTVVMQAIVSKSGRVQDLRVISGHYMLRAAAKDAVRTWRYRPFYIRGGAVEVATIVSVEFHR